MPTPPTITASVIGVGDAYGNATTTRSTWGKCRGLLVNGEEQFTLGSNSIVFDAGFHPDESLLMRADRWPEREVDFLNPTDVIAETGMILTYEDGSAGPPSVNGRIFLGGWSDAAGKTAGALYFDETELDNFITGRLINGTLTATGDWWDEAGTTTFTGQDAGVVTFGGYTSISDMTAF